MQRLRCMSPLLPAGYATCDRQSEDDMERVRTIAAAEHVGRVIRLQGWLHQFRELGRVTFLIIRDGWGTFQAVVSDAAMLERLRSTQVESVIEVRGLVVAEPMAPGGAELHDSEVTILV